MSGLGSNGMFLGVGAAGLVCGSLLAIVLGGGEAPAGLTTPRGVETAAPLAETATSAAPTETAPPVDEAAAAAEAETLRKKLAIATLLPTLEVAHQRLHAPGEAAALADGLKDALKARFPEDDVRRDFVKRLYEEIGVGRFVRGGRLTKLGHAVVERVGALAAHGVDAEPYDPAGLRATVEALAGGDADEAGEAEETDAGKRTLAALLDASTFDAARAGERLAALEALPTAADVDALASALRARGVGGVVRPADVKADVRVADALLQLVLDFRGFVKKAGPFELRKAGTVLERKKEGRALMRAVLAVVEADPAEAMTLVDPPHPEYHRMVAAHARYLELVAAGGCKPLPESWKFRPGAKSEEVKRLQERLACEGYYDGAIDGAYEGLALAAGKRYQREHDLPAEGNIFEETLKSMNVPIERRAEQISLALQRMRESDIGEMGSFFIRVNLPAFELQVYDDGEIVRRHKVIVGTNRLDDDKQKLVQGHLNRTQLFTTKLYEVVVHPAWILPARVEHGELKGKLAEDPNYLEKHNIKLVTLDNGKKVYIQGFGEGNVLGEVKFLLEKSNAIYLHDTDKRALFKERRRDFSHGCIRVDGAVEFAYWLLERDGFSTDEIKRAFKMEDYQRGFDLKQKIDLITEYMTVDLTDDGAPIFYSDIYRYDRDYFDGALPPAVTTRWGAQELRPRWVPKVSQETVDGWRAAGKPAPRDYDPEKHGK
ncbi:MAG: hypothetical protein EP329_25025 [Deltaproteobacteria bacterium]|nr:MAG: hypothetical protein EP329_25025 [Deltaproteobacteria bacterium]